MATDKRGCSEVVGEEEVIQRTARSTPMSKPTIPCGASAGKGGGDLELRSDEQVPWTNRCGVPKLEYLAIVIFNSLLPTPDQMHDTRTPRWSGWWLAIGEPQATAPLCRV